MGWGVYAFQQVILKAGERLKGKGERGKENQNLACVFYLSVIARNVVTKQSLNTGSKQRDCRATLAMTGFFVVDLDVDLRSRSGLPRSAG
jgi:hypothetical protein